MGCESYLPYLSKKKYSFNEKQTIPITRIRNGIPPNFMAIIINGIPTIAVRNLGSNTTTVLRNASFSVDNLVLLHKGEP